MALGTMVGDWRIVRALGSRITRLHPVQGFGAGAGGAATLFMATYFGIPVSTTHTITGAIVGVGGAQGRGGAVERGEQHADRLDFDDAGSRADRRGLPPALQGVALRGRRSPKSAMTLARAT
jgi:phosphate/sulfate permease